MDAGRLAAVVLAVALAPAVANAGDVDKAAAQALMKESNCFKCHSLTREKDAPSYKDIAQKIKGKPAAEQKLYTHLTTNPKVKVDGKEETHDSLKTRDEAAIRNVVGFILAQ